MCEKISIIVPIFNVETYLDRCLISINSQTYDNIEALLVDDGSFDGSSFIADEYSLTYSSIVVIHKSNGGLSDARNWGLLQATGAYVLYLDSDDYIDKNTCRQFHENFSKDLDFIVGNYNEVHNGYIIRIQHTCLINRKTYDSKNLMCKCIKHGEFYAPAWMNFYKKSFLINNSLFFKVGILHEDVEVLLKLYLCAQKIKYLDYNFYNYVIRPDSIMTSATNKNVANNIHYVYSQWLEDIESVQNIRFQKILYGFYLKMYLHDCVIRNIKHMKSVVLTIPFIWKYSLNKKELVKNIFFYYFPSFYIYFYNLFK